MSTINDETTLADGQLATKPVAGNEAGAVVDATASTGPLTTDGADDGELESELR
jgi:hypothetical protein